MELGQFLLIWENLGMESNEEKPTSDIIDTGNSVVSGGQNQVGINWGEFDRFYSVGVSHEGSWENENITWSEKGICDSYFEYHLSMWSMLSALISKLKASYVRY